MTHEKIVKNCVKLDSPILIDGGVDEWERMRSSSIIPMRADDAC
jgi:hypothetical protein